MGTTKGHTPTLKGWTKYVLNFRAGEFFSGTAVVLVVLVPTIGFTTSDTE